MKLYSFLNSFISNFFSFFTILIHVEIFFSLNYHFRNVDFYLRRFVFYIRLSNKQYQLFYSKSYQQPSIHRDCRPKDLQTILDQYNCNSIIKIYLQQEAQCCEMWLYHRVYWNQKKMSTIKMHPVYNILWVEPGNVSQMVSNMLLSVFQQIVANGATPFPV